MGNLTARTFKVTFDPAQTDSIWIENKIRNIDGVHKVEEV